jgi:hypothetical protein
MLGDATTITGESQGFGMIRDNFVGSMHFN